MKKLPMIGLATLVLGLSLAFYAFFIEPKRLTIHQYNVGTADDRQSVITLLQISDIHLKKNYSTDQLNRIVAAANAQKPDIIVFTGDLFDNYANYGPVEETTKLLAELNAPLGKFAIWGNHDYGGGAAAVYPSIWHNSGFQLMENDGLTLRTENDQVIYLAGIDDSLFGTPSLEDALLNRSDGDYTILLTHEPDVADRALGRDVSLILSGHSHGGQVNIPFVPVTNVLAEKYISGFYTLSEETSLYVNTGLGTTLLPVRFRVPPEIAVFTLYF